MSSVTAMPKRAFLELELLCPDAVLAPRFETEAMVAQLLELIDGYFQNGQLRIADFGTGSGAIAAALSRAMPRAQIDAFEQCESACEIAHRNFELLKISNVRLINASWQNATSNYDLIVSNPPYITSACTRRLIEAGLLSDPTAALDGGSDGMGSLRDVIGAAKHRLRSNGMLALEHGLGQHYEVVEELARAGFRIASWGRDLQGLKRFIFASTS